MTTATIPEPISAIQAFLNQPQKLLIDGKRVDAASGETFEVLDPASNKRLTAVPRGGAEDIDRAVAAARRAFENGPWKKITASERGKLLWKLADLIEEHAEEFAQLETLDNGKPITISRAADIPLVVDHFRYYAGLATKIHGETIPISVPYAAGAEFFDFTLREPMGVIGQIHSLETSRCSWPPGNSAWPWLRAIAWSSSPPSRPLFPRCVWRTCSPRPGFPTAW